MSHRIRLDDALSIELPRLEEPLKPEAFETPDGLRGWAIRLSDHPIATPAFADGRLFVGGGYGSYDFYALDAETGELAWRMRTSDDGPSAAVTAEELVAFNTESCTVMVCEQATGRTLWEEWLGDPLMSQPAVADGRLFIVYPAGSSEPVFLAEGEAEGTSASVKASDEPDRVNEHRLLATDLRSGEHLWEQRLPADAITAPVVEGGEVFVTCLDGQCFRMRASDGAVLWRAEAGGTSAPFVAGQAVYETARIDGEDGPLERLRRRDRGSGAVDEEALYECRSGYLRPEHGGGSSLSGDTASSLDASVGFGAPPDSSSLGSASAHVGVYSVAGAWAFQGSRPGRHGNHLIGAQGGSIFAADPSTGSLLWNASAESAHASPDDRLFLPPSFGRRRAYLTTTQGHLLSVDPESGQTAFLYEIPGTIGFQPSLAAGRVFFGTNDGVIVSLQTNEADADDWPMWGGNARHNRN